MPAVSKTAYVQTIFHQNARLNLHEITNLYKLLQATKNEYQCNKIDYKKPPCRYTLQFLRIFPDYL